VEAGVTGKKKRLALPRRLWKISRVARAEKPDGKQSVARAQHDPLPYAE
jgi:hypothetical protein